MYINCSECEKQFLYTTCSPHVLSLVFSFIVDTKLRTSDKDLPVKSIKVLPHGVYLLENFGINITKSHGHLKASFFIKT